MKLLFISEYGHIFVRRVQYHFHCFLTCLDIDQGKDFFDDDTDVLRIELNGTGAGEVEKTGYNGIDPIDFVGDNIFECIAEIFVVVSVL